MKDLTHIRRFNESEENFNISDVRSSYSIGDKYELFYNSNNPNNKKLEIRGIVDNEVVVI